MTLEERNTWIQYFQCQQASQLVDLNKSLGNGICTKKAVLKNNVLSCLIEVLYRYDPDAEENCLTEDQICSIIKFMKRYVKTKCNC